MDRVVKDTYSSKYTDKQKMYEKLPSITNYHMSANQKHNEISPQTC